METLDPLWPAPVEIVMSALVVLTLGYCLFALVQVWRGRWSAGIGLSLVVAALVVPVVGPVVGHWLLRRRTTATVAAAP